MTGKGVVSNRGCGLMPVERFSGLTGWRFFSNARLKKYRLGLIYSRVAAVRRSTRQDIMGWCRIR